MRVSFKYNSLAHEKKRTTQYKNKDLLKPSFFIFPLLNSSTAKVPRFNALNMTERDPIHSFASEVRTTHYTRSRSLSSSDELVKAFVRYRSYR